jgi:hypothetical protein
LVGCVCTGLACATICERKTGSAELCGFVEFLPSDPPKYYKRRRTTGTMSILQYGDPACGGTIIVPSSVECRSKSGTATLIGVLEFADLSLPRKTYRSNGAGGSCTTEKGGSGVNFPCNFGPHVQTYSGAIVFNKTTGVATDSRCYQDNGGPCNPTGLPSAANVPGAGGWVAPSNDANACCGDPLPTACFTSATKTGAVLTGRGDCRSCGVGGHLIVTGTTTAILTDEDLPSDAVARAIAAVGAWTNGTCANSSSFQTPRTGTQTNFTYRFGQTRLVISSGLIIGETYAAAIHVEKRVVGSGSAFIPADDITIPFTAAAAGYTSDWKDLPNDPANEYRASGSTVTFGQEASTQDTWNIDEDFNPSLPAICAPTVVADSSARTVDGVPVAWPFDGVTPNLAYGALAVGTIAPAERQTIGTNVCTDTVGDYSKANGTILESLSDEDTEQDAIDRATASAAWAACLGGCTAPGCTSFETLRGTGAVFGFGIVRTKVTWAATIGTNYQVTIRFASRVLGTGGPFLFYGLTDVVVTADAISEETGWLDAPRAAGLEIIVAICSVVALP